MCVCTFIGFLCWSFYWHILITVQVLLPLPTSPYLSLPLSHPLSPSLSLPLSLSLSFLPPLSLTQCIYLSLSCVCLIVSKSLEEGIKEEITSDGISSKAETLFQSVLSSHSNLLYLQGLYTSLVIVTLEEEMSSLTSGQSGEKRETIDQLLIVLRLLCHSSSSHNLLQLLQEFDDSIIHSSIGIHIIIEHYLFYSFYRSTSLFV